MNLRRSLAAASLAAAFLAAASCRDGTATSGPTFKDAPTLAQQLEAMNRAVATAPLRAFSGLALPINHAGIDVTNITTAELGKTLEWSAIYGEVGFTARAGAPANAIRVILYVTDSTARPAYPPIEVGYADLYPHNTYNGGGPDSTSLRYVVTDTRAAPLVVADFTAHSHADSACVQCASLDGWVSDGTTRVNFHVAYNIPVGSDGRFPGAFTEQGGTMSVEHFATLPGPSSTAATASLSLLFAGDSIAIASGSLHPHGDQLDGPANITIGGTQFAAVTRHGTSFTTTGASHNLTGNELRVAKALFAMPASIAYYVEWPTFVIFFCGC
ncbi:MAG TPA: hypothetical protein VL549_09875 [Gemmatimonadales bacterium]|jgi:hypothetical protein|nr:hypothetical protein [Gemmatimonadales bacterium]